MTAKDDTKLKTAQTTPAAPKRTSIPVDEEEIVHEKPLDWDLIVRLMAFIKPYKWRMTVNVAIVALSTGATLLGAEAVRRVILYMQKGPGSGTDAVVRTVGAALEALGLPAAYMPGSVSVWIAVMAVNAIIVWQLDYYRMMQLMRFGQRILLDLRMTIFRHLQRLSLSYYDRTKQGWIISRATSDIGTLEDILTFTIPQIFSVIFLILGGTILMLVLSPMLFWVLLGAVPLMAAVTFVFHGYIADAWRAVRVQVSRICANLAENIAGVRVVQAFTRERRNLREFDRLNLQYYKARVRATIINALYFPSMGLLTAGATAGVILIFGWTARSLAAQGHPPQVADMIFALILLRMFFDPIRQLSQMYGNALGAMASAERIFQLLDTPPDVRDAPGARELPPIRGDVRFEGVTFAYRPGEPVLVDVSIDARAGQTIALVGATGAGKSSIINLLCRFYEHQEGLITVDGCDLRAVTMQSLRSQMGIVNQDAFLFSGTVMDNIKFGRPSASDEEVYAAAKAIDADDVIAALRDGYRTQVQERGEGLSGGERQLVCFTRAMVADPRILVLDEATSSVDTTTEQKIQHALERLIQRRTSFVVAHRLSTVRHADQVLVVKGGRIMERGTHDSLLAAGGEYARMYKEFLREG